MPRISRKRVTQFDEDLHSLFVEQNLKRRDELLVGIIEGIQAHPELIKENPKSALYLANYVAELILNHTSLHPNRLFPVLISTLEAISLNASDVKRWPSIQRCLLVIARVPNGGLGVDLPDARGQAAREFQRIRATTEEAHLRSVFARSRNAYPRDVVVAFHYIGIVADNERLKRAKRYVDSTPQSRALAAIEVLQRYSYSPPELGQYIFGGLLHVPRRFQSDLVNISQGAMNIMDVIAQRHGSVLAAFQASLGVIADNIRYGGRSGRGLAPVDPVNAVNTSEYYRDQVGYFGQAKEPLTPVDLWYLKMAERAVRPGMTA